MASIRFVNSSLPQLGKTSHSPKLDYKDVPTLTLEESVKSIIHLVPNIVDHALIAKNKCNKNSILLTENESAALYLYTMPIVSFYSKLNNALRIGNRELLKPWLAFLKLFLTALEKLPSLKTTVWRGINYNAGAKFADNEEYTWWNISSCSMNLTVVESFLGVRGTLDPSGTKEPSGTEDPSRTIFNIDTIHGKDITPFSANRDEKEVILIPGTCVRVKGQARDFINRLFIIHLEEICPHSWNSPAVTELIAIPSESSKESNDILDQIKRQYQQNSRIERFMNPSISYPIEQTYINLSIVETKEQREKEKKLRDAQNATAMMSSFEEIYGTKTSIDVKDIFKTCTNTEKQVLVFGRAGIGKSTFCRYITYQWAMGSYWTHYELLALIPLRRLTADRYPPLAPGQSYSLIDLVRKEILSYDLSETEQELLKKQFDPKKILWILDGYDEIVQNVPPHLQCLFEQLLKTPHHIVTSRPYLNKLPYDVQMEITGFTDNNIENYVENFFDQMKDELDDAFLKCQKLLRFLRSNLSIWGVVHIPINLELICSLWSNEDCSLTEQLTMTRLYTIMTEWLCRRYSKTQNDQIQQLPDDEIHQCCQKELAFLESLAFTAMENNTIIIRPALLKTARKEAKIFFQEHPHILNIGILKSFHKQGIGNQIEMNKDYYFVHLSFQEYFAARYLINRLKGSQTDKAIEFIQYQKYNRRYTLVFSFAAGLLSDSDEIHWQNLFWDTVLRKSLDLVGVRHMQLVISCLEETTNKSTLPRRSELLEWIAQCLKYSFTEEGKIIREPLIQSLQRAQLITCDDIILNVLIDVLEQDDVKRKVAVLSCIYELPISNPSISLITSLTIVLNDENVQVRSCASSVLLEIHDKATTNEVITKLVAALGDQNWKVRSNACNALRQIGEKAATTEVITKLMSALGDQSEDVRTDACEALGEICEKAAKNEVITKLVSALGDQSEHVRMNACKALGKIGEKATTNEVITKLVAALGDKNWKVRSSACDALVKIGEKATTNEVITLLVSAIGDQSKDVREIVCETLGNIGVKAATTEVITKLVSALGDGSEYVRGTACRALTKIGAKAATTEVITLLVSALGNQSKDVRENACEVLGKIGEKAATTEVITKLVSTLGDRSWAVIRNACEALGKIGDKAATTEVITLLVSALGNQSKDVRENACEVLGNLGEKAATTEVITKLASALVDQSWEVRRNACEALRNMGEKAATHEVITKLMSALVDQSWEVRRNACDALGNMGEKGATTEVITKLVTVLEDQDEYVRMYACSALVKIGEKAATTEVITKLVSALGDQSWEVRINACEALGKIGEKAATNDVIIRLAAIADGEDESISDEARDAIASILSSSAVIAQLDPRIITDVCLHDGASVYIKNISEDDFVKTFFRTENSTWISFIARFTLLKGWAVVAVSNNVVVYGMNEPIKVFIDNSHLHQHFINAFIDQGERLHLYFVRPSDA